VLRVGLILGNLVVQRHVERVDLCGLELAGGHLALKQDVELGMSAYVSHVWPELSLYLTSAKVRPVGSGRRKKW
jgi:hypothetical protein